MPAFVFSRLLFSKKSSENEESKLLYNIRAYVLSVLFLRAGRVWLLSDPVAGILIAIIIFAIAGMLFVIPTTAEIPIIQSLGLSGGPAAALLITLPVVSLPSLLMVAKSFPKKALFFVMVAIMILGVISGLVGKMML